MKVMKWSEISEITTPLLILETFALVMIWSIRETELLLILVAFSIHWKKLLSLMDDR